MLILSHHNREIPAEFVREDDRVVINDINPQAPSLLVIPPSTSTRLMMRQKNMKHCWDICCGGRWQNVPT